MLGIRFLIQINQKKEGKIDVKHFLGKHFLINNKNTIEKLSIMLYNDKKESFCLYIDTKGGIYRMDLMVLAQNVVGMVAVAAFIIAVITIIYALKCKPWWML